MPDHKHFAEVVLAHFRARTLHTDAEVKDAGGPSSTWMTNLRKAADGESLKADPRNDTFKRIDTAAGWSIGSARNLYYHGIEPVLRDDIVPFEEQTVGGASHTRTEPAWNTRKPEGMSDAEHRRILQEAEEYYQWLIEKASRDR